MSLRKHCLSFGMVFVLAGWILALTPSCSTNTISDPKADINKARTVITATNQVTNEFPMTLRSQSSRQEKTTTIAPSLADLVSPAPRKPTPTAAAPRKPTPTAAPRLTSSPASPSMTPTTPHPNLDSASNALVNTDLKHSGQGILVGTSADSYAIANHQQWHLFYHDGWWIFFKDKTGHLQVVHVQDDGSVTYRNRVSHREISRGFTAITHNDTVYIVYTDSNDQYAYLRTATITNKILALTDPITVARGSRSFSIQYPSITIDNEEKPWIVYRSYETGERFPIWITTTTGESLVAWTKPTLVSTSSQDVHSSFATSAAIAAIADKLVVVSSGNPFSETSSRYLFQYESPSVFPPVWSRSIVSQRFSGIHDYSLRTTDDTLRLAYVRAGDPGLQMVYRYRKLGDDWSEPRVIGQTVQHSTAVTIDSAGRPWIFYVPPTNPQGAVLAPDEDQRIFVRVVDSATNAIVSSRCLLRVPPCSSDHLWGKCYSLDCCSV